MSSTESSAAGTHQTITPHLVAKNAAEAITFYTQAFGAKELYRMPCPETQKVMHAELLIGNSRLYLCDEFLCDESSEMENPRSPQTVGGSPVVIHLQVDDVDAVFERAVQAGAKAAMAPENMFWGDRYGKVIDPFGHHWSIATQIEEVTPEQIQQRASAHFSQAG